VFWSPFQEMGTITSHLLVVTNRGKKVEDANLELVEWTILWKGSCAHWNIKKEISQGSVKTLENLCWVGMYGNLVEASAVVKDFSAKFCDKDEILFFTPKRRLRTLPKREQLHWFCLFEIHVEIGEEPWQLKLMVKIAPLRQKLRKWRINFEIINWK